MCFVNTGETRMVFVFDKHVIKIPRCMGYAPSHGIVHSILRGWLANRTEYKWSGRRKVLCPVTVSLLFSFIIVMERADSITEEEFDNLPEDLGFNSFERKVDSLGKLNGEITIIDYG